MEKKNPSVAGSSASDTTVTRARARTKQNVRLILLDLSINEEDHEDGQNSVRQLQHVVNGVSVFEDVDECVTFLLETKNEKVIMIISDSLAQRVVPLVHDISQLDSIFIFFTTKKYLQQWAKDWSKIKGMFKEIASIYQAVKVLVHQCEENTIPISFISTSDSDRASNKNLDQLECSFMYTQILKEILLTITFEEQHFNEFIEFYRKESTGDTQLANVQKFKREYRNHTPIFWYTREIFLYSTLNRALRVMDVDLTIKTGFFMNDLHHHISELHHVQFLGEHNGHPFIVYRGQGLSKVDFDKLQKTKGGLLSFNNFLSTSKIRGVSLMLAESIQMNPDLIGILFVMNINPSLSTTPFASIESISNFREEGEVLFSMHTVFRIGTFELLDENKYLWQVELTLTSDNDPDLCVLTKYIRQETFPYEKGWCRLGQLLLTLGQPDKAQRVYEFLLEQASSDSERAPAYHHIGKVKDHLGEYEEAIKFYDESLEIFQNILPPYHPSFARIYNNIGSVYDNKANNSKALFYYEKALETCQKSLPPNHPDLAMSYNNIALVYEKMADHSKALSFHEKALEIYEKSLPPNHPSLSTSYNNIGLVYDKIGDYPKALASHEKALEIYKKSLPPDHPDLATSYNNIGSVYSIMQNNPKALSYYEKSYEILREALSPDYPNLAGSCYNIAEVYFMMGNFSRALSFCERAVDIGQRALSANHPYFQLWKNTLEWMRKICLLNMFFVYMKMNRG